MSGSPPAYRPLSFLAFDFGTKRVGVASGNTVTHAASPLRTIAEPGDARFAAIGKLIDEWKPDALVVGIPYHPDGWTSATARPKRRPAERATSMRRPRRSSLSNT
jgi:putative holliday junction resolvase